MRHTVPGQPRSAVRFGSGNDMRAFIVKNPLLLPLVGLAALLWLDIQHRLRTFHSACDRLEQSTNGYMTNPVLDALHPAGVVDEAAFNRRLSAVVVLIEGEGPESDLYRNWSRTLRQLQRACSKRSMFAILGE